MAAPGNLKLPTNAPSQASLTQGLFNKGVITLINESNLPTDALKEAQNAMLYENGAVGPRWGVNWYGNTVPGIGSLDGASSYIGVNGAVQIVAVHGGNVYRSVDNGNTWLPRTGATLTPGYKVEFAQASQATGLTSNYMYLTNGKDVITRFDGSSTLVQYTPITKVTSVSATQTGLGGSAYTYYYRVTAVNNIGATEGSVTASVNVLTARSAWDPTNTGSKYVTITWPAVTGAVRYDIYLTDNASDDAANNLFYLDSVGNTTYIDRGQAGTNPNSAVPIQNTTSGPVLGELQFVGSRLVGTRDATNKYRVWWTGSGPFLGYFSDAYDGGYIDLQRGSPFYPVHTEDYRDGKGTPLITVWCDSADGRGCIWQMSLDTATVQGQNFTQPNANKLPGSRGTSAPHSVVNVLNDFFFINYQGWYNLGSRAQFLNLLSTDEISVNIRPTLLNSLTPSAVKSVAAFYYRAKVFCSVPRNGTVNNAIDVYDTERKAWIPNSYTMGAERFFQYADSNGVQHLLFWKPGDNRFSETSEKIAGDYGQAFTVSITTGLTPVNPKDHFAFFYTDQAEVEFSQPQGSLTVNLNGIERVKGYSKIKSATINNASSQINTGWDTFAWDVNPWDTSGTITNVYAEPSSKRWFIVSKDLNAYQWNITSNSLQSQFLTRQLQIQGVPTDGGFPRQWRVQAK